jgi:hypothetical protein
MARCYSTEIDSIEDEEEQDKECNTCHDRASDAEAAMVRLGAKTPAGAAVLLWSALPHIDANRWVDERISTGAFAEFLADAEHLDFGPRLVAAAIASLQQMEA